METEWNTLPFRYVSKKPVGINEIIFKDKAGKKTRCVAIKIV